MSPIEGVLTLLAVAGFLLGIIANMRLDDVDKKLK